MRMVEDCETQCQRLVWVVGGSSRVPWMVRMMEMDGSKDVGDGDGGNDRDLKKE